MASEEPDVGFKITDRRGRTDDNPPRPVEQQRPEPPRQSAGSPPSPRLEPEPAVASDDPRRSLVGLFMMVGSSALVALGEAEDPATGDRAPDLPGAADLIDVLVLLREKTQGHRSAEETQVLDDLVYDLQLRYVNATRRSG
jgi:Domain of unknown function (DUF1844)